MPKPSEPDKIPVSYPSTLHKPFRLTDKSINKPKQITSTSQLRIEFDSLHTALALEETEHTWEKIDKAVKRFQAVVRGGAGKKELAEEYVRGMRDKTFANGIIRSVSNLLTFWPKQKLIRGGTARYRENSFEWINIGFDGLFYSSRTSVRASTTSIPTYTPPTTLPDEQALHFSISNYNYQYHQEH